MPDLKTLEQSFNEAHPSPHRVVVWLDGGLVQAIAADTRVEVVVVDQDTDGCSDDDDVDTVSAFGTEEPYDAFVRNWGVVDCEPERVAHIFTAAGAA